MYLLQWKHISHLCPTIGSSNTLSYVKHVHRIVSVVSLGFWGSAVPGKVFSSGLWSFFLSTLCKSEWLTWLAYSSAYVNIAWCLFPLYVLFIFDEDKVLKFTCNSVCEEERGRGGGRERERERESLNHTPFSFALWVYGCECVLCILPLKGRML